MANVFLYSLICDGSTGGPTIPGSTYYPTKISLRLKHATGTGSAVNVTPCLWRVNNSSGAVTLLEEGASFNVPTTQTTYTTYETPLYGASVIAATTSTEILATGFLISGAGSSQVDIAARAGNAGDFTGYLLSGSPSDYTSCLQSDFSLMSSNTPLMWVDMDTSPLPGGGNVAGSLSETEDDDTVSASGTTVVVTGTLSETEDNDTSAASGAQNHIGTLSETEDDDASAASATLAAYPLPAIGEANIEQATVEIQTTSFLPETVTLPATTSAFNIDYNPNDASAWIRFLTDGTMTRYDNDAIGPVPPTGRWCNVNPALEHWVKLDWTTNNPNSYDATGTWLSLTAAGGADRTFGYDTAISGGAGLSETYTISIATGADPNNPDALSTTQFTLTVIKSP